MTFKCDFCDEPAVAVSGETNGLLVCKKHQLEKP